MLRKAWTYNDGQDPVNVQIEPGGETEATRNESVAFESAGAGISEAGGMRQGTQDEGRG